MEPRIKVLIADDDETFRKVLSRELSLLGFQLGLAATGEETLETLTKQDYDVILLDIRMPGQGGIATLPKIKEVSPSTEVVILTGYGNLQDAIKCMKLGAYDYVTKPCPLEELEAVITKAYEKRLLAEQNLRLRHDLARRMDSSEFIGQSPTLLLLLETISKVAPTDYTVLIQGESGTGKELVARAIHRQSQRASAPFVVIDCAALHENLLESELFGHEKGAYTGAASAKPGLLEVAHTGTLFLDEVGEIHPAIQAKLLRVLESRSFRRLGGIKDLETDVRIVAATNRDLAELVNQERFRRDLFYRLNVISITVPPLRDRKEDIPLLVRQFAQRGCPNLKDKVEISSSALDILTLYPWPGNVRELQNVVERAIILSSRKTIEPADLPEDIRNWGIGPPADAHLSLRELERNYIERILSQTGGHRAKAAQILGISVRNLYRKIKEYNLSP